jgi:hypothetical protein
VAREEAAMSGDQKAARRGNNASGWRTRKEMKLGPEDKRVAGGEWRPHRAQLVERLWCAG